MKEITVKLYEYSELNEAAKENVKLWYLNNCLDGDCFTELVIEELKTVFPNSELTVVYQLSYCQGDGLNIEGKLNLYDFIAIWEAEKHEKNYISNILNYTNSIYIFYKNQKHGYSCKFLDEKYIKCTVNEVVSDLKSYEVQGIDRFTILKFFEDMVKYFAELDKRYEKMGYSYFFEADEEEIKDFCTSNDYYFTADGKLY